MGTIRGGGERGAAVAEVDVARTAGAAAGAADVAGLLLVVVAVAAGTTNKTQTKRQFEQQKRTNYFNKPVFASFNDYKNKKYYSHKK